MKTTIKFSFSFYSNATDVIMKFQLFLGCAASGNVNLLLRLKMWTVVEESLKIMVCVG